MVPRSLRRYLPSRESVRQNRFLQRHGAFLQHPGLWRLNRQSVSVGFAIGLFAGLIPGPLQMLTAALLAIPLKVNLPVALATTLYTNPLTIGPLYFLAYAYGRLLLGGDGGPAASPPAFDWLNLWTWMESYAAWALNLGKPLFIGLIALALTLAVCGWVLVQGAWRLHVALTLRRRNGRRAARKGG